MFIRHITPLIIKIALLFNSFCIHAQTGQFMKLETIQPMILKQTAQAVKSKPFKFETIELKPIKIDPSINLTKVPPFTQGGSKRMDYIIGHVHNSETTNTRVVLYACTDRCYVQPYVDAPFTKINADGAWATSIHLGKQYIALLVKSSYQPAATLPSIVSLESLYRDANIISVANKSKAN